MRNLESQMGVGKVSVQRQVDDLTHELDRLHLHRGPEIPSPDIVIPFVYDGEPLDGSSTSPSFHMPYPGGTLYYANISARDVGTGSLGVVVTSYDRLFTNPFEVWSVSVPSSPYIKNFSEVGDYVETGSHIIVTITGTGWDGVNVQLHFYTGG